MVWGALMPYLARRFPIRWLLVGTALLLAVLVYYLRPVLAAGGTPDSLLPLPPPRPRTPLHLLHSLGTLMMTSHTEKSVVLARVVAVERGDIGQFAPNPAKADRQKQQAAVRLRPESRIETLGGRFQVLETLVTWTGAPAPATRGCGRRFKPSSSTLPSRSRFAMPRSP